MLKRLQPDLSVIVIAHNLGRNILSCLNSLKNQEIEKAEYLIIDDGSTDNTGKVIKEYIKKYADPRFKYVQKCQGGVGDARNYGLKLSEGKYVIFVDGDDYYVNDSKIFIKLFQLMEKDDLDILEYNFYWVKNNKVIKQNYDSHDAIDTTDGKNFIKQVYADKKGLMPQTWKFIFNNSFLNNNNFNFEILNASEDVLWIWQLLNKSKRVRRIVTPYYAYISRNNSIMHNFNSEATKRRSESELYVLEKVKNIILNMKLDKKLEDIILSSIAKNYISSVITGYANGLHINKDRIKKFIYKINIDSKDKIKLFITIYLPHFLGKRIAYLIWDKRIKQI